MAENHLVSSKECKADACSQMYCGVGGQAVIEGIMMKNGEKYSIGIRKPDGSIDVMEDTYQSMPDKYPILKVPFIRGIFSFVDSMVLGMKCLTYSASFLEDDPDEEPGKFEKFLDRVFGEKVEAVLSGVAVTFAMIMAILLFALLPTFLASFIRPYLPHESMIAFIEGILRVVIFILYIKLISRTPDIRKTFEYHGAEHKCINCIEHGLPLTVKDVAASSKEHKRCGTSFIVYVMLISILLFMVIRTDSVLMRVISRIVLIPVIAGVSYEVLRFVGTHDNILTRILFVPGMWMQGLTTNEPDDSEIEVAIAAVNKIFDWKAWQDEHFKAVKQ